MKILGVKVDNFSKKETLEKVEGFLAEDEFHQIVTINPEFILQAQKDAEFKNILNGCELNVADGVGIWFAFLRFGKYLKNRITGVDLMLEILKIAENKKIKVFLASYGGALSAWEEARAAILQIYPALEVSGANLDRGAEFCSLITDNCIVFCNFGAPSQEKFLNKLKNAKIRLAMGVGGSFDFLTGKRKRAPKFVQIMGLEWLWRFLGEPKRRAKRIWNATIIFPIKVLLNN